MLISRRQKQDFERRYRVEGEGGRKFRQNRREIIVARSDEEAAQYKGDGNTSAARDDGSVFTLCGRRLKSPDWLNLYLNAWLWLTSIFVI